MGPDSFLDELIDTSPDDPADAAPPPAPEPAAAAPPAPDVPPPAPHAAPAAEQPPTDAGKTIPLASHLEERNRLKSQIDELRAQVNQTAQVKEQLAALQAELAALKNPPKPPEPEIDFAEDPKAYIDRKNSEVLEAVKALEKMGNERLTEQQQQVAMVQFQTAVAASEEAFAAVTPDYQETRDWYRQLRGAQLSLIPDATEERIIQQIYLEERQIAAAALQRGMNPAEYIYRLAQQTRRAMVPNLHPGASMSATPPGPLVKDQAPPPAAPPPAPPLNKEALRSLGAGGGDEPPTQHPDDDDLDAVGAVLAVQKAFMRR